MSESLALAEGSPVVIKYVALVMGILVVVAFGVRPAVRRARPVPVVKEVAKADPKELPAGVSAEDQQAANQEKAAHIAHSIRPGELPLNDPERIRAQEIFDQVTGHLKMEPTQSSRLLQSWIHSD
jgi:flagellar M-ring protein FliF